MGCACTPRRTLVDPLVTSFAMVIGTMLDDIEPLAMRCVADAVEGVPLPALNCGLMVESVLAYTPTPSATTLPTRSTPLSAGTALCDTRNDSGTQAPTGRSASGRQIKVVEPDVGWFTSVLVGAGEPDPATYDTPTGSTSRTAVLYSGSALPLQAFTETVSSDPYNTVDELRTETVNPPVGGAATPVPYGGRLATPTVSRVNTVATRAKVSPGGFTFARSSASRCTCGHSIAVRDTRSIHSRTYSSIARRPIPPISRTPTNVPPDTERARTTWPRRSIGARSPGISRTVTVLSRSTAAEVTRPMPSAPRSTTCAWCGPISARIGAGARRLERRNRARTISLTAVSSGTSTATPPTSSARSTPFVPSASPTIDSTARATSATSRATTATIAPRRVRIAARWSRPATLSNSTAATGLRPPMPMARTSAAIDTTRSSAADCSNVPGLSSPADSIQRAAAASAAVTASASSTVAFTGTGTMPVNSAPTVTATATA